MIQQNVYSRYYLQGPRKAVWKINFIVVCFHLGNSPASEFYMPTFRNTLFHLHKQVGMKYFIPTCLWKWNIQSVHTYLPMKMEPTECSYLPAYEDGTYRVFIPTCLWKWNMQSVHTYLPMKMEQTVSLRQDKLQKQCSETSVCKIQTLGNYPEKKHTTFRTRRKFEMKNTFIVTEMVFVTFNCF